jgi:hypothetical protein
MKSKLALAVSLALAGTAYAGQQQPTEDLYEQDQTQEQEVKKPYGHSSDQAIDKSKPGHNPVMTMNEDDIHGKSVVDPQGNKIGDADEIWINQMTQEKVITVDLQGVLGDNNKEVAIPVREFSLTADGEELQLTYTKEQLQTRPDFDESDYAEVEEAE